MHHTLISRLLLAHTSRPCMPVPQPLSGAPGYLPGFPLLAGVEASAPAAADPSSTRKAVSRLAHGLQLPGPGPAGRCSPSSVYAPTIGWGNNMSSTCNIGMTLSQVSRHSVNGSVLLCWHVTTCFLGCALSEAEALEGLTWCECRKPCALYGSRSCSAVVKPVSREEVDAQVHRVCTSWVGSVHVCACAPPHLCACSCAPCAPPTNLARC